MGNAYVNVRSGDNVGVGGYYPRGWDNVWE